MRCVPLPRLIVSFYLILSVLPFFGIGDGFSEVNGVSKTLIRTLRQTKKCDGKLRNWDENCDQMPPEPTPLPVPIPTGEYRGCVLPEHPIFGRWTSTLYLPKRPGERVAPDTILRYECDDGYKLSSNIRFVKCLVNKWDPTEAPTCLRSRKCKPLYTTKFTTIRCFDEKNIEIKCDEATDGASAIFKCAPYYEPSDRARITRFCYGGSWNYPEPVCQPVCGNKRVSAQPLILNGKTIERSDYPWVTAIFYKVDTFKNVCGGTMLTQKVILTAAHCVTNDYGNKLPNEKIRVAVGKYYRKYNDSRDTMAQYSEVEKIIVPEKYRGDSQRYTSDIAILVTKDALLLSAVVQPVCYQNDENFLDLDHRLVGVVTGWGYTAAEGKPSDKLKNIEVPSVPESQCTKDLPLDWIDKYLTYDKMCARRYNKSMSLCKGDSGGGLVYKYNERYHVKGVLSIMGPKKDSDTDAGCDDTQLSSLYTKVSSHYEWLEKTISENNEW